MPLAGGPIDQLDKKSGTEPLSAELLHHRDRKLRDTVGNEALAVVATSEETAPRRPHELGAVSRPALCPTSVLDLGNDSQVSWSVAEAVDVRVGLSRRAVNLERFF